MPYISFIRSTQEWIRSHIHRDTIAWRALLAMKRSLVRFDAALHAKSWAAADQRYESALTALTDQTPDFFFVQIGAHDGTMDDPLAPWIAKHHWRGLFVEPQPEQFARLRSRYMDRAESFLFENIAIDRETGFRTLYRVSEAHLHSPEISGLASFLPDRALSTHAALGRMTQITVPCAPLNVLLARHDIKRINLLQIDTEGHDAVVLETIDLQKIRPDLIHYEHRHLSTAEQDACSRRLRAHGYEVHLQQFDAFAILVR